MANGDPLLIGLTQPPNNRATAGTLLVHSGSAFGTQHTAFWVMRTGAPACNTALRGDNNSTGAPAGIQKTGVTGAVPANSGGIGVLGSTSATGSPPLFSGDTGVMGVTSSFGVIGRSLLGIIVDEQGTFISGTGVVGSCDAGVGVHGIARSGFGIIGQSDGRAGVTGTSVNGNGVEGRSEQGFAGVRAQSNRFIGVLGNSQQGVGVAGVSTGNAIVGLSTGATGGAIGVVGQCDAGGGVMGASITGIGVGGRSQQGWAGYFDGKVYIQGALVVAGTKSAAIRHPDGTHRALFCMESPESYFEDFGEVALEGASVTVRLARDFAALVKRNDYQVFLTSYGPEPLYVRKRTAGSFEIARVSRKAASKMARVRVGYRIVARRADVKRARLPKIDRLPRASMVVDLDQPSGRGRRIRAGAFGPSAKVEPLPAPPRIPSPTLRALPGGKPARGRAPRRRR